MDNDTITLILGLTLGLTVVGVVIGLIIINANAKQAGAQATNGAASNGISMPGPSTYSNEEKWSVIKDADGRVKDIIVHRTARES